MYSERVMTWGVFEFVNLWGCTYVYIMIIERDGKERRQEMRLGGGAKGGKNDGERVRNVLTPG